MNIYKLMNEHKELSPTIVSEDKLTEKDLKPGICHRTFNIL